MPGTTRTPLPRPPAARAYYLARPAWWLTAVRQPHLNPGTEAGQ